MAKRKSNDERIDEVLMMTGNYLSDEEKARLAGAIMDDTAMTLDVFEAFARQLSDTNRGELACRFADEAQNEGGEDG